MSIEQLKALEAEIAAENAANRAAERARFEARMARTDRIIRMADESLAESGMYYGIDY